MTYPDGIDALVNVNANDTLAAGGHAARHNSTNTALAEVRDALGFITSINTQAGTAYTVDATDIGKLVTLTSGSATTVTVPTALGYPTGGQVQFAALGTGVVTITGASGVDVFNNQGTATPKLRTQYSAATLVNLGSNDYLLIGDLD
jgi:hypothetical protein